MAIATAHLYEVSLSDGKIDRANNTIRQVSLMSLGKVRGHEDEDGDDIWVDGTTLSQVFDCLTGMKSLKVKARHRGSVFEIVGYVDQFEKTGSQVLGDLHFYDAEPEKDRLFEIAQKNPEHLGLSLEFDGEDEKLGNKTFSRCSEVGAVALAPEAAANTSLFEKSAKNVDSTTKKSKNTSMAKKNFDATGSAGDAGAAPDRAKMFDEFCKKYADDTAMMKKFDDFLTNSDGKPAPAGADKNIDPNVTPVTVNDQDSEIKLKGKEMSDDEKDEDEKDDDKKDDKVNESTRKEMEALETRLTKKFAASLGGKLPPPGVGPGITSGKDSAKNYAQLVTEKTAELNGDRVKAQLFCLGKYPKEYAEHRKQFLKVEPKTNRYL